MQFTAITGAGLTFWHNSFILNRAGLSYRSVVPTVYHVLLALHSGKVDKTTGQCNTSDKTELKRQEWVKNNLMLHFERSKVGKLTSASAITSAQHYSLHHWASKRHCFSELHNNVTEGRLDSFMIDIRISPRTFHNESHNRCRQLIKERHNFFPKHLTISNFTRVVIIWNMPSEQPYQLVF